jgi:hypothetical protein
MFCGECGTDNPDNNSFCKNCGKALKKPQPAAPPVVPVPVTPSVSPVVQPASTTVKQPWSSGKKLALVSIICGIGAFIVIPYILGILGVILGALSLREKYKPGAAGIVICVAAMLVNYLYIFIF